MWPRWITGALLAAGCAAVVCRLFVPSASPYLPWLFAAPLLTILPAWFVSTRRSYRGAEVLALADAMTGGDGLILTLSERPGDEWRHAAQITRAERLVLPRLRPWRRLASAAPALAFLVVAVLLPQRVPAFSSAAMAGVMTTELSSALAQLQAKELVTPEEEKRLEEEIERVREAARQRMDASAWEAADAVKEKLAATAAGKQDAAQWAQDAMAAYAAAVAGGLDPASDAAAGPRAELSRALDALAKSGLLAGAPANLQTMLGAGSKLPVDAAALEQLAASFGEYLGNVRATLARLRSAEGMPGRFDPSEFEAAASREGSGGVPGRGGVNRGRADAEMTWGKESEPADRFKAQALPPGFVRSPDDWAPIVSMPGAPNVAPESNGRSVARVYGDEVGQAAWRRTLAPRHQSAVKKYFQP